MNSLKKWIVGFALGILLICTAVTIFLIYYDFPREINLEYPAMEYRVGDPSTAESISVRINGTLSRPLFRDAVFNGEMVFDKYEFTHTQRLMEVVFNQELRNGLSSVYYHRIFDGKPELTGFAMMWIAGDFEQLNLIIFEPIGEPGIATDLRISAPAQTYDEAILIDEYLYSD